MRHPTCADGRQRAGRGRPDLQHGDVAAARASVLRMLPLRLHFVADRGERRQPALESRRVKIAVVSAVRRDQREEETSLASAELWRFSCCRRDVLLATFSRPVARRTSASQRARTHRDHDSPLEHRVCAAASVLSALFVARAALRVTRRIQAQKQQVGSGSRRPANSTMSSGGALFASRAPAPAQLLFLLRLQGWVSAVALCVPRPRCIRDCEQATG